MHVLHRPHLPRAAMITTIAAVLAIAVTLIFASTVGDVGGSSSSSPAPSFSTPAVHQQTAAPAWTLNPVAPLLRTAVIAPWTEQRPFLAR